MNYKLNYMCLKRGVSLILGHGVLCFYIFSSRLSVQLKKPQNMFYNPFFDISKR